MHIPVSEIVYKNRPVNILRLDLAGDGISGNKYFKLKYNLEDAAKSGVDTLLTFGGAFSNHLHAVAMAGYKQGFKTIGIVRGEDDPQNPTLKSLKQMGMHLHFLSRQDYTQKNTDKFRIELEHLFGHFFLLPEGGTNALAVKGCSEILQGKENAFDNIYCAAATGGTLAGIISTPGLRADIIGISVLRGKDMISEEIQKYVDTNNLNWKISTDYHLGGYAKYNTALLNFIHWFSENYQIQLDPVYTGKVAYAVFDLIDKNYFPPQNRILIIHTGGLQGLEGWKYRFSDTSFTL